MARAGRACREARVWAKSRAVPRGDQAGVASAIVGVRVRRLSDCVLTSTLKRSGSRAPEGVRVKAIEREFGDQLGPASPYGRRARVTARAPVPSGFVTTIPERLTTARNLPSGEKLAATAPRRMTFVSFVAGSRAYNEPPLTKTISPLARAEAGDALTAPAATNRAPTNTAEAAKHVPSRTRFPVLRIARAVKQKNFALAMNGICELQRDCVRTVKAGFPSVRSRPC